MSAAKIAFIGGGHMASALIGGLRRAGQDPESILVVEPSQSQREKLAREFAISPLAQASPALSEASTVVWAVKPQAFHEAAAPCRGLFGQALHLSVMAGIRSQAIATAMRSERVVRAMPNTPALIGQGVAGLFAREAVAAGDRLQVERLLAPTGRVLWFPRESDLDAVTALSGSGPAYVFYVLEAMMEAASRMGLDEAAGRELVLATFEGATALAQASPLPPAELRAQVTSKGGTTHAAITSMQADGVKPAVVKGILAACERARQMGDEFGDAFGE